MCVIPSKRAQFRFRTETRAPALPAPPQDMVDPFEEIDFDVLTHVFAFFTLPSLAAAAPSLTTAAPSLAAIWEGASSLK